MLQFIVIINYFNFDNYYIIINYHNLSFLEWNGLHSIL